MGLDSTDGGFPDWQGPYYDGPWVDPWGTNYFIDYDYHLPDGMEVPGKLDLTMSMNTKRS